MQGAQQHSPASHHAGSPGRSSSQRCASLSEPRLPMPEASICHGEDETDAENKHGDHTGEETSDTPWRVGTPGGWTVGEQQGLPGTKRGPQSHPTMERRKRLRVSFRKQDKSRRGENGRGKNSGGCRLGSPQDRSRANGENRRAEAGSRLPVG